MQAQGTRMFRVRDVAARYDVSTSTIYRAIESGQLDAIKLGTGRGTVRVPDYALRAFEKACGLTVSVPGAAGELVGEVSR